MTLVLLSQLSTESVGGLYHFEVKTSFLKEDVMCIMTTENLNFCMFPA